MDKKDEYVDVAFVVAAGGSSSRFGGGNKLFRELDGMPVFLHCLRTAHLAMPGCTVVLAVSAAARADFEERIHKFLPELQVRIVPGGATRTESVFHGLCALDRTRIHVAAIHDAARPFLPAQALLDSVTAARKYLAAVVCHKICDTVKEADPSGWICRTVPREPLWAAETPQTFQLETLMPAYEQALKSGEPLTDDSMIVELYGGIRPMVVENRLPNGKITFREDLPEPGKKGGKETSEP